LAARSFMAKILLRISPGSEDKDTVLFHLGWLISKVIEACRATAIGVLLGVDLDPGAFLFASWKATTEPKSWKCN
jgi:hypothetical protein